MRELLKRNIVALALIFVFVLLASSCKQEAPGIPLLYYHFPSALRFSDRAETVKADTGTNKEIIRQWYKDMRNLGLSGMINVVGYWFDDPEDFRYRMDHAWEMRNYNGGLGVAERIKIAKEAGIDLHFLCIQLFQHGVYGRVPARADHSGRKLEYESLRSIPWKGYAAYIKDKTISFFAFPDFQDSNGSEHVLSVVKVVAELAEQNNCQGIAIDIEPYHSGRGQPGFLFFQPHAYRDYSEKEVRDYFRDMGENIAMSAHSVFPDVMILCIGLDNENAKSPLYGDFLKGLSTYRNVIVLTESTYYSSSPFEIKKKYKRLKAWINKYSSQNNESVLPAIALGSMPLTLDAEYFVRHKMNADQFRQQMLSFIRLNPAYIWLYPNNVDFLSGECSEYASVLRGINK